MQWSLFDEQNLAEFVSPDYPGERLVGCYAPLLARERARKREALLAATEAGLERIAREAARRTRTPLDAAQLGHKVGAVIARHKMAKHFRWTVHDGPLVHERDQARVDAEARLDGLYVLRTRDPVAAARPTARARRKKASRRTGDGAPLHSLDTLLGKLATRGRNTCRVPADPSAPPLSVLTEPTPTQRRAARLIESFPVPGTSKS